MNLWSYDWSIVVWNEPMNILEILRTSSENDGNKTCFRDEETPGRMNHDSAESDRLLTTEWQTCLLLFHSWIQPLLVDSTLEANPPQTPEPFTTWMLFSTFSKIRFRKWTQCFRPEALRPPPVSCSPQTHPPPAPTPPLWRASRSLWAWTCQHN